MPGPGNPPDKPGEYKMIAIGTKASTQDELNFLHKQGFVFVAMNRDFIVMYKDEK